MLIASLVFAERQWLWPVLGGAAALGLVLVWSYRTTPRGWVRNTCLLLKFIGVAALSLCLLEPLWSGQRARPGANLMAVVADNSQGLQIRDVEASRSRGEGLRDLLDAGKSSWIPALAESFEIRRYQFDSRLQAVPDFSELTFDGRSSAMVGALRSVGERNRGRPLAGVLLFTDGNATDLAGVVPDLKGLPPIYPVVIGGSESPRDLSVQGVRTSQTAFEDAPVTLDADVSADGFAGREVTAQLTDESGKLVAEQTRRADGDHARLTFQFRPKPEKSGLAFYRFSVAPSGASTPETAEATAANNSRVVVVDRGRGPHRILYVTGRPNWEFKFLNRALAEDSQVQLVGLIRVARREPKFEFRGRAGETSNPLFRGFGDQSREETQRYDQPVLVRLNTRDELELRSGFPRTPEELYPYHAVIVDDLEAEFFQPDQQALLQKYVSERGGGFLMLGGAESFQQGGYARTPIGDFLPVYLDRRADAVPAVPRRLVLAREGWLQAWARLRDNEADERARREAMPPFQVINRLGEVKPGASVIATAADASGGEVPALVVQRYGRGRTAALTVGDVWRWGMQNAESHADMDKAWRQLARWLVAEVPDTVELSAEPVPGDPNGAVRLQARVRDPKFQPMDNAGVTLEVQPVLASGSGAGVTNVLRLPAEPSTTEPGAYEAVYVPRLTGGFRARAQVTNSTGVAVGTAEAGWSTDLAAEEFRSLVPNVALLEEVARKTGGEVIRADRLEEFAKSLPQRQAPVMDTWSYPLWHTPWMFALALGCLISEWGLRRWKGMP
ncbi:MAG: glutamine amidotransferase [Verrucomicrobiota bacterium]